MNESAGEDRRRVVNPSLKQGILTVFNANVIALLCQILLGFLQPKFLPVDAYATLKTFVLYQSLAGVFHLGYANGMQLQYGGYSLYDIDGKKLGEEISTMRWFLLIMAMTVAGIAWIRTDIVLLMLAAYIVPYNMSASFDVIAQATGYFRIIGKTTKLRNYLILAGNLMLILIIREKRFLPYIILYPFVYVLLWIFQEYHFMRVFHMRFRFCAFSFTGLVSNIRSGILVMFGEFSSILFFSMDRWFVKYLLPEIVFARYSFAVSLGSMLTAVILPFSTTLYNFFCKEENDHRQRDILGFMVVYVTVVIMAAFPVRILITHYLPAYREAMNLIVFLFCAQAVFILVLCVYVNLYKAAKKQKRYFMKMAVALVSGILFNLILFLAFHSADAIAVGTVCSAILWLVLCQPDFAEMRLNVRQWVYLIVMLGSFVTTNVFLHATTGFLLYLIIFVCSGMLLIRKDFIYTAQSAVRLLFHRRTSLQNGASNG